MGVSLCFFIKSSKNIFNFRERADFKKAVLSKLKCRDTVHLKIKFYVATSEEKGLQTSQSTQAPFYFNSIPFFSKSAQEICLHSIKEDKF